MFANKQGQQQREQQQQQQRKTNYTKKRQADGNVIKAMLETDRQRDSQERQSDMVWNAWPNKATPKIKRPLSQPERRCVPDAVPAPTRSMPALPPSSSPSPSPSPSPVISVRCDRQCCCF